MSTKYGPHQITPEQALQLIDARSNGAYYTENCKPGEAYVISEWCLAETEGLAALLRHHAAEAGVTVEGIAEAEVIVDREGDPVAPYGISVRQAREYIDHHKRDKLDGVSASKGGRVWIDEAIWTVAELEALCVLMRAEAGDGADGAPETLAMWARWEEERHDEADNPDRHEP